MTQLTEEQQKRVRQIRERAKALTWQRDKEDLLASTDVERAYENTINDLLGDIEYCVSLLDSDSQAVEPIPDDLPYRIVEAMGLGLTFRSCTCGQLPCARLRPLRDALETAQRDATNAAFKDAAEIVARLPVRISRAGVKKGSDLNGWSSAINEAVKALEAARVENKKGEG